MSFVSKTDILIVARQHNRDDKRHSYRRALFYIREVALTLAALPCIHRDLKPGNLLFANEPDLLVADFGLTLPSDPAVRTTWGDRLTCAGTRAYMAPEQATGEPLNHTTDQIALAIILHELIALEPSIARQIDIIT